MSGYDKYLEYQYRQTGGFLTKLFDAIAVADEDNTEKLSKGFPEHVDAVRVWRTEGAQALLEKISPDHHLRQRFVNEYVLEDNQDGSAD